MFKGGVYIRQKTLELTITNNHHALAIQHSTMVPLKIPLQSGGSSTHSWISPGVNGIPAAISVDARAAITHYFSKAI